MNAFGLPIFHAFSFLYLSLQMMCGKSGSTLEADSDYAPDSLIYAISSEGGDVMYHVSKDAGPHSKKFFPPSAKQILALTTLTNNKLVTENVQMAEYEVPYMGEGGSDERQMSVLVNPFSRHPWLEIQEMSDMNKAGGKESQGDGGAKDCEVSSASSATELQDGCSSTHDMPTSGADVPSTSPDDQSNNQEDRSSSVQDTSEDDRSSLTSATSEGNKLTSREIAESVVTEIIDRVVNECTERQQQRQTSSGPESLDSSDTATECRSSSLKPSDMTLHPLHSHMLLYTQLVDSGQSLYGLTLLKNILESQPKLSLLSFASTGISSLQSQSELMVLMARHKQCVLGHGFDSGNSSEIVGQYRSVMYLQVVITVCLYYIRSYYPQLPHLRLKDEHLQDNKEVQVVAVEILELVFTNLSSLVSESPRGLAPYVLDLLNKCKVQKCVLYCLLATVHAMRLPGNTINSQTNRALEAKTFTQELLDYNYKGNKELPSASHEIYLFNVMSLTLSLIKLEDALSAAKIDGLPKDSSSGGKSQSFAHYQIGQTIPAQSMFLRVLFSALGQKHTRHLHSAWLRLFSATLPYMGQALPTNTVRTSSFLCILLEELPKYYKSSMSNLSSLKSIPPDYTLTLLSSLTTIVHYCLLDQTQSTMTCGVPYISSTHMPSALMSAGNTAAANSATSSSSSHSTGHLFFNLFNVFSPVHDVMEDCIDSNELDAVSSARKALLSHLPRLVAMLLPLWSATSSEVEVSSELEIMKQYYEMDAPCIAGSRSTVVQQIITFLSPICHHHATHFLASISVVWQVSESYPSRFISFSFRLDCLFFH